MSWHQLCIAFNCLELNYREARARERDGENRRGWHARMGQCGENRREIELNSRLQLDIHNSIKEVFEYKRRKRNLFWSFHVISSIYPKLLLLSYGFIAFTNMNIYQFKCFRRRRSLMLICDCGNLKKRWKQTEGDYSEFFRVGDEAIGSSPSRLFWLKMKLLVATRRAASAIEATSKVE
jgi:hypothetical protein